MSIPVLRHVDEIISNEQFLVQLPKSALLVHTALLLLLSYLI